MKYKLLFLLILFLLTPRVYADNFSCTSNKVIGSITAKIQVSGVGIHDYLVTIIPVTSSRNPNPAIVYPDASTTQSDTLGTYLFTTQPTTGYRVQVVDANEQLIQNIKGCQFETLSATSNNISVPGAPTGVSVIVGNAQATVTFSPPASNGGSAITGYTVTSIPSGGVDSNAGSTSLNHVITGLTNGTSYTFTVTATNSQGSSGPSIASSPASPSVNALPPTPPTSTFVNPPAPANVKSPTHVLTPEEIAADKVGNGLVPCKDTCDFNDFMTLINNLIKFLITELFIPIIIILFMYSGYKYLTADGNPSKIADIKKTVKNVVVGMLLVLCSWLIVKTIISIVVKDENGALQFLQK